MFYMNINYSAWLFLIGVLIFQTFSTLPSLIWLLALPIIVAIMVYFPRARSICMVLLGLFWAFIAANQLLLPKLDASLEGQDIELIGDIQELTHNHPGYTKFILNVHSANWQNQSVEIPRKLVLSWYSNWQVLKRNQYCELTVRLKRHWRYANSGSTDIEKSMFLNAVGARGYVRAGHCEAEIEVSNVNTSLRSYLIQKYESIEHQFRNKEMMLALTFGERGQLSDQQWNNLRETGTVHLVAISGLHLSIISAFVFMCMNYLLKHSVFICDRFPACKIAALSAIIMAVLYAYLADFTLPTQRALVMVSVALMAVYFGIPIASHVVFAVALFAILIMDPHAVLTASFWMSFTAVFFILLINKYSAPEESNLSKTLKVQVYLGLALLPISFWVFQTGSIIAPLVNLLAVPYVSLLVLPFLLLAQLLFFLNIAWAENLLQLSDYLFDGLWWLIAFFAELPLSALEFQPSFLGVLAFELGLILWIIGRYFPMRILALPMFLAIALHNVYKMSSDEMQLTVLDVGQGLSLILKTQHHSFIYDTGPSYASGFNTGDMVVLPYLKNKNIHRIDKLIVSHSDNDHAGSVNTILKGIEVSELVVGEKIELEQDVQISTRLCVQGDEWQWDGVVFKVLHPPRNWHSNDNNHSCVIHVMHRAGSVLITGDIEAIVEKQLVEQYGDNLRSDVLIAPHHGSKSSSSRRFLARVRPQMAIFSVGYRNRYGFPHANIVSRYEEIDSEHMTTASEGAILIQFDAQDGIRKEPGFRHRTQRYWHSDL